MLAHQEHDGFEQRAFDQPALAGALAHLERQDRAEGAKHAADDIDHRGTGAQGPAGRAGHVGQSTHHLHDLVERRPLLVGPRQKALECTIDQPRVDLLQMHGPQPALAHRARGKIFDHHVGRLQELYQHRAALGRIGVERQALLVAVEVAEKAAAEAAQLARAIAVHRLDLDHLGAQVGQDHAARRPEDGMAEFDDTDALEGRFDTHCDVSLSVVLSAAKDLIEESNGRQPSHGTGMRSFASLRMTERSLVGAVANAYANHVSTSLVSGRPAASPSTRWAMPAPTKNASWWGSALALSMRRMARPSWPQPIASTLPSKARFRRARKSARSASDSPGTASMSPSTNSRPRNLATRAATELRGSTITSRLGPRRTRAANDSGSTAAPRWAPESMITEASSL